MVTKEQKQKEVDENFKYFEEHLLEIQRRSDGNPYVLLHDKKVISYHKSFAAAVQEGRRLYQDHLYSVQEVANTIADLGFQGYALFHSQSDE